MVKKNNNNNKNNTKDGEKNNDGKKDNENLNNNKEKDNDKEKNNEDGKQNNNKNEENNNDDKNKNDDKNNDQEKNNNEEKNNEINNSPLFFFILPTFNEEEKDDHNDCGSDKEKDSSHKETDSNNDTELNDDLDEWDRLLKEEERKQREEEEKERNKNKKRRNNDLFIQTNNGLGNFFKNIIEGNIKDSKRQKINSANDFKSYFKEADVLVPIDKPVKTLTDLIELGKTYDPKDKNRYVINMRSLNKCVKPLEELNAMIGMKNIKEMIIDLIFFRLQNIEDDTNELWHLVIQGTPGSGKTEVAKILAKLYHGLGITKTDKITFAKRSDLIGKYLGHTAKMTQEVFDNSKGGILFIDEAYSLGNPEQRDSFSKECIDTINQNLTENRDTVVFIAGYKEQLNDSFFSYNPGLNRRFKMRLTIDKYTPSELKQIFLKKVSENNWFIKDDNHEKEIPLSFFEKNKDVFKYNGGDMENLWHLTKIVHARRIFGKSNDFLKKITLEDLEKGFKAYCENEEVKQRQDNGMAEYIRNTMYC